VNKLEIIMAIVERTDAQQSEEILKVLRMLKDNPEMTQRELSSRLGLSLGKTNFLMRAVIRRGLVKVQNFKNSQNKNAYLYYLTPSGLEEKTKTTYFFLKRKMREYEELEEEIRQLRKEASDMVSGKPSDLRNEDLP
jgi:EPS-associated MarR family transcriptional regulator